MNVFKPLAFATLWFVLALGSDASDPRQAGEPESFAGRSSTPLPDGSSLLLGGMGSRGPADEGVLVSPEGGASGVPRPILRTRRAWHTATLLPSGEVLVFGGVDSAGRVMASPELVDAARGVAIPLPARGLTPRATHTATVLSDGRVLLAGGIGAEGHPLDTLDLWDPRVQLATRLTARLPSARYHHAAALLADGSVLLSGGLAADGNAPTMDERYFPESGEISRTGVEVRDPPEVTMTGGLPADGATDIPLDLVAGLRFSRLLRRETVNPGTVTLTGPGGLVASRALATEGGRLVFLTPREDLLPGERYTLSLSGLTDRRGKALPATEINFTTSSPDDRERGDTREELEVDDPSWRALPPLEAPAGVTAIAGQVLRLNGRPLPDVILEIGQEATRTDGTGRFLLSPILSGWHELTIDGRTASRPAATYGVFEARVEVLKGITNPLPFTIWMPRLDTDHAVRLASPTSTEVVATTPAIPGLEVHIPPGTVLRDLDGNIASEVSITAIPVDRPPFPLPDGVQVPIYFTVQPGGSYFQSRSGRGVGASIIYPNYMHLQAGTRVDFWRYDPEYRGWYVYGQGTVDSAAKQVVPDPPVRIYELTGAMISVPGLSPPGSGPVPGSNAEDGDPVDLGTGLFVFRKTDLVLPDVLPLALTRTYRPLDSASRSFGIGTTHPYDMFLWSARQWQEADLILADGGRIHYARVSPGTGFLDAVFEHSTTPTAFQKSRIRWLIETRGWELKLKDGTTFLFGEEAPLYAIRDRYGNTVRIERAGVNGRGFPIGNITRILSPNGRWIQFTNDSRNRITRAEDNSGRAVTYAYDSSGRLAKVTDPAGNATTYAYDSAHRMTKITDPRGITFLTNQYDTAGRVTSQKQADGGVFQFSYTTDSNNRITHAKVTDPRGVVRQVTFNGAGFPTQETLALGRPEEQTFLSARDPLTQLLISVTDSLGRKTAFAYDGSRDLTSVTRLAGTPAAVTTRFTHELTFHQLASVTDPLGHTTAISYDAAGNSVAVTDALGHATTFTYDTAGLLQTVADPLGNTTRFSYEGSDLIGITDPLGHQVRRFVDDAGRLLSVIDALGRVTLYEHDPLNQLTRIGDPLGGITSFAYDGNGNLLTLTDPRGSVTHFAYDSMDRLASRTDPLGRREKYEYDQASNLTHYVDRKGQIARASFDSLNRPLNLAYHDSSSTGYTHDAGNRLTRITDSQSGTIAFAYDTEDRLASETTAQGTISHTYDGAGRRTATTITGQPPIAYGYDPADRLLSIKQGLLDVSFTYDSAGKRQTARLPNGVDAEYQYDAHSQLTAIVYRAGGLPLGNLTYSYDATGNRTGVGGTLARVSLPPPVSAATYDAANQLTTWGPSRLTWDANGNETGDGTRSYTWNARDQLIGITGPVAGAFQYDALDRRTTKTVGGVTTYQYDGFDSIQERSSTTATAILLGETVDEVLARTRGAETRVLLADALASTLGIVGPTATIDTHYTYEPFGRTTATGAPSSNPTQFTGRENDDDGLYYYRARYYDPRLQRFLSEDPLRMDEGQVSPYVYVNNSPANFRDPSGQFIVGLAPYATACLGGAALSYGLDTLSGRKPTLENMGYGCAAGLAGLGLARGIGALGLGMSARALPNVGGVSLSLTKNGRRILGMDWHKFRLNELNGRTLNRPHLHYGRNAAARRMHRPWQGGWRY